MKSVLGLFVIMAAALSSTSRPLPGNPAKSPESNGGVQVIEVTANKYEFTPSPIRVKQGTRVQLKITATDHAHGFKIKPPKQQSESVRNQSVFSLPALERGLGRLPLHPPPMLPTCSI
jgi:heme/copper-type cytochrome/quinol oxidase subunit 2